MTPWDKTLANFKAQKASGDPYWHAGEMVPVHELLPYREVNRRLEPKYPGHFEDVKAHVEQNGITDMGILMYNPDTHRVYQGEGNTRLAVAKELGFSHVPVRVWRSSHEKKAGGIAPRGWDRSTQGRPPADIRPSQIGFTPMKMEESRMNQNNLSILLREANRILEDQVSTGATTFGPNPTKSFNNVIQKPTTQTQVKAKIDTALSKTLTVSEMIQRIREGHFDWQELDRLYGSDFRDIKNPELAHDVHPGYSDVADLLVHHGYMPHPADKNRQSTEYRHEDGHTVDVDPKNLEWNHYQRGDGQGFHGSVPNWTSAGRGIADLDHHLRSFHRVW